MKEIKETLEELEWNFEDEMDDNIHWPLVNLLEKELELRLYWELALDLNLGLNNNIWTR